MWQLSTVMQITCRHRKWLLVGAFLIALGLGTGLRFRSNEPDYNGHPLSYWFGELPVTIVGAGQFLTAESICVNGRSYGSLREKPSVSLSAIQHIGTNGLPFIIRKLSRDEPRFVR